MAGRVIKAAARVYGGGPIRAQADFIERIQRTGLAVFNQFIRRVDTPYGPAPEYGVPVVLRSISGGNYTVAEDELTKLTNEFLSRV